MNKESTLESSILDKALELGIAKCLRDVRNITRELPWFLKVVFIKPFADRP